MSGATWRKTRNHKTCTMVQRSPRAAAKAVKRHCRMPGTYRQRNYYNKQLIRAKESPASNPIGTDTGQACPNLKWCVPDLKPAAYLRADPLVFPITHILLIHKLIHINREDGSPWKLSGMTPILLQPEHVEFSRSVQSYHFLHIKYVRFFLTWKTGSPFS